MKIRLSIFFLLLSSFTFAQLQMGGWQMHNAYGNVNRVVNGFNKVYALSNGSLMSVDKEDGTIEYYNKLTGLTSSGISKIYFDRDGLQLIIAYSNGYIDFLREDGSVENLNDLYMAQVSVNKTVQDIVIDGRTAYMAMDFGIMEVSLLRKEIKETYYIGDNASAVNVRELSICRDSLFALSDTTIYVAALSDNKIDYHNWKRLSLPSQGRVMGLETYDDGLYLLLDSVIYLYDDDLWKTCAEGNSYYRIRRASHGLLALNANHTHLINGTDIEQEINYFFGSQDVDYDPTTHYYWYAYNTGGVGLYNSVNHTHSGYRPNGPISDKAYRLRITGDRLYVVPGGYWAVKNNTNSTAMYYENGVWKNYGYSYFYNALGYDSSDYSDIIGDPQDPSHFFIATFSVGLIEFRNNEFYKLHDVTNSPFISAIESNPRLYTWVDGLVFDEEGNLFVECIMSGLCMLDKTGLWTVFKNSATYDLNRSKQVLISNKNKNIKIIVCNRDGAGIGIMDDRGTLYNSADDKAVFHHVFVDQNNNNVVPEYIYTIEQDLTGELWVGTSSGLFIIPDVEQLFSNNSCRRVIISRTDGSGLGDYLLSNEQINAIAIDGANRKWIGTQGSGLYLMSKDGTETIEHYTIDNSSLPDNSILSLALNNKSGELFIGTGAGLVSYQTNSAEAHENLSNAYAYPNPVRENFEGQITICQLSENTSVKIVNSAGDLVAETTSLGSLAVWDGKDSAGKRVPSGVYFAQCVSSEGNDYALVKILIIR